MENCGPGCESRQHAGELCAVVTSIAEHEERVLIYLKSACTNAVHNHDSLGRYLLHVAASAGRMRIVDWLVEAGAVINIRDVESGYTPLHRALFYGQLSVARYLLSKQASLGRKDNDNLTPLDHLVLDRLAHHGPDIKLPCDVYVWGSNSNYTLGRTHSSNIPRMLDCLRRCSVAELAMSKFHSIFVTQSGQVYTCGHGQGGRLGHGSAEASVVIPSRIHTLDKQVCVQVAAAADHSLFLMDSGTVWSCGSNHYMQSGHTEGDQSTPKRVAALDRKTIQGVCAARYHSVFWSYNEILTCGLNAGQLGHLKGEWAVATPKKVTSLAAERPIAAAASDGATAVATDSGNLYVLQEFQCRKVASRLQGLQALHKIVMVGGSLLDGDSCCHEPTRLQMVVLTKCGRIYTWNDANPTLTRCILRSAHQIVIRDVALSSRRLLLVSNTGEAFYGTRIPQDHVCGQRRSINHGVRDGCGWKRFANVEEHSEHVKIERIPGVFRAVAAASDPEGKNFSILQTRPSAHLKQVSEISPSQLRVDYGRLLDESSVDDALHDLVLQGKFRQFATHRFILASRCPAFYRELCRRHPHVCGSVRDRQTVRLVPEIADDIVDLILRFIYTGQVVLQAGSDVSRLAALRTWCEDLGVEHLVKLLDNNGTRFNYGLQTTPEEQLRLRRSPDCALVDLVVQSADGQEFLGHRVVLAGRLEYFRSMFGCGWAEAGQQQVGSTVSLPVHSSVLGVLLDYIYEDRVRGLESSDDVDWIVDVLALADQLLIGRLVNVCEVALMSLITLSNVGRLLHVACMCNAVQLESACMQMLCLNLPTVVELGLWDELSEEQMTKLTNYYRNWNPAVSCRTIAASSLAPTIQQLDSFISHNGGSKQEQKKAGDRRKSPRKERLVSTSSTHTIDEAESAEQSQQVVRERLVSTGSTLSVEETGPAELQKMEREAWLTVAKVKRINKQVKSVESCGTPSTAAEPAPPVESSAASDASFRRQVDSDLVLPPKPLSTLFEVAVVSKAFGKKLSQKQRKLLTSPKASVENQTADQNTSSEASPGVPTSPSAWKSSQEVTQDPIRDPFRSIVASQLQRKRNLCAMRTKPLKLTLTEEAAMQDLLDFYQAEVVCDEYITVERVMDCEFATPVWRPTAKQQAFPS